MVFGWLPFLYKMKSSCKMFEQNRNENLARLQLILEQNYCVSALSHYMYNNNNKVVRLCLCVCEIVRRISWLVELKSEAKNCQHFRSHQLNNFWFKHFKVILKFTIQLQSQVFELCLLEEKLLLYLMLPLKRLR